MTGTGPPRSSSTKAPARSSATRSGTILSGAAGGPLFEILASIVTTLHGPHFVPIEWEFDKEARTAKLYG